MVYLFLGGTSARKSLGSSWPLVEPLEGGWLYRVEPDRPPLPAVKAALESFTQLLRLHTADLTRAPPGHHQSTTRAPLEHHQSTTRALPEHH